MSRDSASILVVDDAVDTLEILGRNLSSRGYRVYSAPGVLEAIEILGTTPVDLVITDLKMPKISGLDLVRYVRENQKDTEVIMITGYATIESAVEAVKLGAEEYLPKPFTDDELFVAVGRALEKLRARRAIQPGAGQPSHGSHGIVGSSRAIQEVVQAIGRVANSNATVLITGESGVGKDLVAKAVHRSGTRSSAPFIPINCGAIPHELFESELFGHVKGSFTGAGESRVGLFQAAHDGTIFLDEVSEMSPAAQVKLLRVVEDGEVWMVGSTQPRKVDLRILAATNRDLRALVRAGAFRDDLYFRLTVITVDVPPLRERGDDILQLAEHFTARFAREERKSAPGFTDAAVRSLMGYAWPGNVRELENLMHHLVVMSDAATIDACDLPAFLRFTVAGGAGEGPTRSLAAMEADYIKRVLESVSGNKTQAAKILGIDRKTLREKLKGEGR